jgi:hypothetical protein
MPSHSLNYLQPLNVGYFTPLKEAYSAAVMKSIHNSIHYIDKQNFLNLYREL